MSDTQQTDIPVNEPYIDEKRHDDLKDKLANIINELAALTPEITLDSAETIRLSVEYKLRLTPYARIKANTYYGDNSANSHLCNSRSDVQTQAATQRNIYQGKIGLEAAKKLGKDNPFKLFIDAGDNKVLSLPLVSRSFSFVYVCPNRGCKSGKVGCPSCGGSGNQLVSEQKVVMVEGQAQTRYYNYVVACRRCGGNGRVVCRTCDGHGKLTYREDLYTEVKLDGEWLIQAPSFDEFAGFMQYQKHKKLLADYFDLRLLKVPYIENGAAIYHYGDTPLMTDATAIIAEKPFFIRSMGKKNRLILTPPILDYLLNDAFEEVILEAQQRGRRRVKRSLLDKLRKYPFFDSAFSGIARQPKVDPEKLLFQYSQGFLSPERREIVAKAMRLMLRYMTPGYTVPIWWLGWAVIIYLGLFQGMNGSIEKPMLVSGGIALVLTYLISLIVTSIRRRRIPIEFRTRRRERVPIFLSVVFMGVAIFIGFKMPTADQAKVRQVNWEYLGPTLEMAALWKVSLNNKKKFNSNYSNRSYFIRRIQRALNDTGYSVGKVDGVLGPGTTRALRHFQLDRGYAPNAVPDRKALQMLFAMQKVRRYFGPFS